MCLHMFAILGLFRGVQIDIQALNSILVDSGLRMVRIWRFRGQIYF